MEAEPGDFPERFRKARLAAGFTQRVLAERAGIGYPTIARIESGARLPNAANAAAIAKALDAPDLLVGVPDAETAERLRAQRSAEGRRGQKRPDAAERMHRLHAEKRTQATSAKGELLDANELAARRGISANAVRARSCVGKLEPIRLPGVVSLKGQPRVFFRPETDWAPRGTHPESLRALFSTHVGPIRQRALGKVLGGPYGKLGGRKRIALSEEHCAEVRRLAGLGWGRRAIASRLGLSEWAVRSALDA